MFTLIIIILASCLLFLLSYNCSAWCSVLLRAGREHFLPSFLSRKCVSYHSSSRESSRNWWILIQMMHILPRYAFLQLSSVHIYSAKIDIYTYIRQWHLDTDICLCDLHMCRLACTNILCLLACMCMCLSLSLFWVNVMFHRFQLDKLALLQCRERALYSIFFRCMSYINFTSSIQKEIGRTFEDLVNQRLVKDSISKF